MRILFVCPDAPYPPRDGGSLRIVNLARSLARCAEVALLTYVGFCDEARALEHWGRESNIQVRCVQRPARHNQLTRAWYKLSRHHASYLLSRIPGPVRFNAHPVMRAELGATMSEFKPDALVWEYWFMSRFAELARQLSPETIQILDEIDVEWVRLSRWANLGGGFYAWWAGFTEPKVRRYVLERYRQVDAVTVLTEADQNTVRHATSDASRVWVLPMGLMLDDYPHLDAGRSNRLLFFGSFHHAPNVDALEYLLRNLFPLIRQARAELMLDIMGQALPKHLIALASSQPGVHVLGFQSDIRPLLSEAAVVIAPLRFGSGVKVKLLEAMAFGKAVVTTSIGAEGIRAEPGREWVVADEVTAIVRETLRLLDNESMRREMGRHAHDWVCRHHNATDIADSVMRRLEEMQSRT